MSAYLGDFTPGKTIRLKWNSGDLTGAGSTASSVTAKVYKDSSTTTETTSGVTHTEDFDSVTGLNEVVIDTSADGTFYAAGSEFFVILTAATVNGVSVAGTEVGRFSLANRSALRPTTADRTLDVSAGGEAGLDWANIGSPTTTVGLSGTTIGTVSTNSDKTGYTVSTVSDKTGYALTAAYDAAKTASQAGDAMALTSSERTTLTAAIWAALTSGLTTVGSIGKLIVDNIDAAISTRSTYAGGDTSGTTTLLGRLTSTRAGLLDHLDADVSSRLATSSYTSPDNTSITAIKAKTDNLPASPAATSDIPSANDNADALLDRSDAVETSLTVRGALRLALAALAGKLSGAASTTVTIRNVGDSKDRITATVDADGNRTAVTTDAT